MRTSAKYFGSAGQVTWAKMAQN